VVKTPSSSRCTLAILDFESVAELEELTIGASAGLQRLPIPKVVPQSAGNVIEVRESTHAEEVLDIVDGGGVLATERLVDVADDGLDIGRTVGRHVGPDRLEVFPEINDGFHNTG